MGKRNKSVNHNVSISVSIESCSDGIYCDQAHYKVPYLCLYLGLVICYVSVQQNILILR